MVVSRLCADVLRQQDRTDRICLFQDRKLTTADVVHKSREECSKEWQSILIITRGPRIVHFDIKSTIKSIHPGWLAGCRMNLKWFWGRKDSSIFEFDVFFEILVLSNLNAKPEKHFSMNITLNPSPIFQFSAGLQQLSGKYEFSELISFCISAKQFDLLFIDW